ncbi:Cdk-activating kinase assembly factor [Parasponia andersonii]|uniref:Cdk-activating kinase assembly factor n=1 Tax=Parasponia andersonii TaxID=3476 RepID=A0A2P5BGL2_PARAD|nr:Cdk-activating kinase assembly factor [Parasponia andersonii]
MKGQKCRNLKALKYKSFQDFFLPLSHDLQPLPWSPETHLLGFIVTNISLSQNNDNSSVSINGNEIVTLIREMPLNLDDPDAVHDDFSIKVVNMRMAEVGLIEKAAAAVLAPLMDSGSITVQGIVLEKQSQVNSDNVMVVPCHIHIFAEIGSFPILMSKILRSGLLFFSLCDESCSTPEEARVVVEEKRRLFKDDIYELVSGERLQKSGTLSALFSAPEEAIKPGLCRFQREGLCWLVQREGSEQLPPFWKENNGCYVNMLTGYETKIRPEPLRGGILADDVGMGKTLTMISLIAFDKYPGGLRYATSSENVMEEVVKKRKTDKDANLEESSCRKTTLIVCPPPALSTWNTELRERTKRGSFEVCRYHGWQSAEELQKYDIVLITYGMLATAYSSLKSPVMEINWWRVILDDAHVIRNTKALPTRAVCQLKANRRWVVTGTPIQDGAFDLFSFMVFLRFEPFSNESYWQNHIQIPLAHENETGLSRLQSMVAAISLTRTKEQTRILMMKPIHVEDHPFDLSTEERKVYDQIEKVAKKVLKEYIRAGSPMTKYTTVLSTILLLRQVCTHLALCPSDIESWLSSIKTEDVSNNQEQLEKIVEILQDCEDLQCPICSSLPTNMEIAHCCHIFCKRCNSDKQIIHSESPCPICCRPLKPSIRYTAPSTSLEANNESCSSRLMMSTKVSVLLSLLKQSKEQNSITKSVVFTQFKKMLVLLEKPLKEAGFKVSCLDRSMNEIQRTQVIEEFGASEKDGPTVLIASLNTYGTGINLSSASRVYFLEPWWNPAVEERAIGRVHTIWKFDEVKVVRLIARNSIEEEMLGSHEKKWNFAKEAFKRADSVSFIDPGIPISFEGNLNFAKETFRRAWSKERRDLRINSLRSLAWAL